MATPTGTAAPATAWEANCMFCGEGLPDEGGGFIDHVAVNIGCHDAYGHWLEELDHDWSGGD